MSFLIFFLTLGAEGINDGGWNMGEEQQQRRLTFLSHDTCFSPSPPSSSQLIRYRVATAVIIAPGFLTTPNPSESEMFIYRSPGNCCGIFVNVPFRRRGLERTSQHGTCFFFYIIFIIAWHLHWIARAANSAASSVDTGRRPWRMSFLICRKNWYLRRKTQK